MKVSLNLKKYIIAGLMTACFMSGGCGLGSHERYVMPVSTQKVYEKASVPDINDITVREDKSVYGNDDEGSIVTMYLTVRRGNPAENTDHTWTEINQYSIYDYLAMGVERYGVEAILQVGDEYGPSEGELGYNAIVPNAIVTIRGATTSRHPQKSFKISLKENAGTWRNQKTIALNKHVFDYTRLRNKLSYDYIKQIPDMIGLRTQFVHLYVKDETSGGHNAKFEDYGLFTQVEQPNKRFLKNHGLDSGGQLYKANFFEFLRYPEQLVLKKDPAYVVKQFESILEIKGNEDHTKLLAMLEDVNDYSKPIEQVFEKHFDADNYFTWMAFNILTGNTDTQTQNFYIYSPTNSNKWYFIPWDYDGAWRRYEDESVFGIEKPGYEWGISNYWGVVLHKRVLALPKYRNILDKKIKELYQWMTPDKTRDMLEKYKPVVLNLTFTMPDILHLPCGRALL